MNYFVIQNFFKTKAGELPSPALSAKNTDIFFQEFSVLYK